MRLLHGLFVSLLLGVISVTAAAQAYRITALGSLPDALSASPLGINSRGDVAGGVSTSNGVFGVIWSHNGAMQVLPTLDGTNGVNRGNFANAVNDVGEAVGESELATGQGFGALWKSGAVVALMPLAAYPEGSYAAGINDYGWIVGISDGAARNSARATLWVNGAPTALPTSTFASTAVAINNAGEVVGWSSTSQTTAGPTHGTLWDVRNGTTVDLGTLPGATESRAEGINGLGQIVGYSETAGEQAQHPVLWEDGSITDLGLPTGSGAVNGVALSINNGGQIVGYSQVPGPCSLCDFATLWQDGQAVDLNTLIDASDPLKGTVQLEVAESINDRGQIAVAGFSAGQPRAYLLTPVTDHGG